MSNSIIIPCDILKELEPDSVVQMTYFLHKGYMCSDGFSVADARVVCRQQGFQYGTSYKASAAGKTTVTFLHNVNELTKRGPACHIMFSHAKSAWFLYKDDRS